MEKKSQQQLNIFMKISKKKVDLKNGVSSVIGIMSMKIMGIRATVGIIATNSDDK